MCMHTILFYNLIGNARFRYQKLIAFPVNVTKHSPSSAFEERDC